MFHGLRVSSPFQGEDQGGGTRAPNKQSRTMGRPRPELRSDLRSFPFRDYMIFFYYTDDALEVVNVLSARRDIDAHFDQGRK